jgi:hypothetical protein
MNDYVGAILEDVNHKFDAIMEGLQALAPVPARLDRIEGRLDHVESDVTIIKQVVKEHSQVLSEHSRDLTEIKAGLQLQNHEVRITRLEQAA